jgi:hypothetical protein
VAALFTAVAAVFLTVEAVEVVANPKPATTRRPSSTRPPFLHLK